jgi:hypothetical protein
LGTTAATSDALAAARDGLREYYNPLSGRGLAARDFGMSALLADLLANSGTITPDPSATATMMNP